jgi:hypothetical protein
LHVRCGKEDRRRMQNKRIIFQLETRRRYILYTPKGHVIEEFSYIVFSYPFPFFFFLPASI